MEFLRSKSPKFYYALLLVFLILNCFNVLRSDAQFIPQQEVETLQTIATKLQSRYWKWPSSTNTSCTRSNGFDGTFANNNSGVTPVFNCDCTFNNGTVCHVTYIQLKGLNLTGVLPAEFGNLTFLRVLDLSWNYVNGTIPKSLAQIPLVTLSLWGNRMSGSIPAVIGDITTLEELYLDNNSLEGPLPGNLGNLNRMRRMHLHANFFTGRIPETFSNLKNLTSFLIDENSLSGKIPDLIGNWSKIIRLDMQGTSMSGPIPSSISQLKNLIQLRISDLNGPSSSFPNLQDMKNLTTLILRNCILTGPIPRYIGNFTEMNTLDLSNNRLSGEIPATIKSLTAMNFMFLTNNSLNGTVSNWILNNENNFDISYNNFSNYNFGKFSKPSCKPQPNVNLVSSSSSDSNTITWCLRKDLPCPGSAKHYSLFINSGGGPMSFGGNEYEEDSTNIGPSHFFASETKWAYSSTGTYIYNDKGDYTARNTFSLNVTGYYETARVAPSSLKYYGLCMQKGSYRVQLHFAEIMYSDDQTVSSIGRRIFDVSIQGNVVLKDFNIVEEAKGVGKGITKDFNITVNSSTLEIHLYWLGKGTTFRDVYGPLISAITVTPNFKVDGSGLPAGVIAGLVVASFVFLVLVLLALWKTGYLGGRDLEDKELRGLDLQTGYFSLRQIKAATGNFDPANKIGEGGFGPVYKGVLSDGAVIAVKQLSAKSKQGNREFVNEIGMISALQHPHLVKLFGCCIEGNQLLLVYEYLENNSLARALFGRDDQRLNLDWQTRKKICVQIARGLAYLHEESRLKIVHRDIKATNVLLDKNLNAKISDFGLAKLDDEENTHISTRIAGTIGYMAPEYATRGYLTDKADVYSFGIVALEIVSGKSNTNYRPKEEFVYLLDWAYVLEEQGNLLELVDPVLGSHYDKDNALKMLNLALLCANPSPTLRPSMSAVVSMLDGKVPVQKLVIKRSNAANQEMRFKAFGNLSQDSQTFSTSSNENQMQKSISSDGLWIDSSVFVQCKDETLLCTNVSPVVRPTMSSVVSMLEGRAVVKDITSDTPVTYEEMNFQAMKDHYENNQEQSLIENHITHDGLWSGSSTSDVDLYPINSGYLKSRA